MNLELFPWPLGSTMYTRTYTHVQPSKCVAIMWKRFKYVHIENDYEHELPLQLNHQSWYLGVTKKQE